MITTTSRHRRRSLLVMRLVFGLTVIALLVSIFMMCEETFLQRLTSSLTTIITTRAPQQEAQEGQRRHNATFSPSLLTPPSFLNVRPISLNECTTVRFRSDNEEESSISYTVDEAMDIIILRRKRQQQQNPNNNTNLTPLRIGLVFVENPHDFVSLSKGVFHLFHFLEFLVVAYTELHRLQQAIIINGSSNTTVAAAVMNKKGANGPTLQAVQVPWLYVPLLTPQEICGAAQGINYLILNIILTATIPAQQSSNAPLIDIFGIEANDNMTRQVHKAFTGIWSKRKTNHSTTGINVDALHQVALHQSSSSLSSHQQQHAAHADLVLLVDRQSCKRQQQQRIQKMWTNNIADNSINNKNESNNDNDNNDLWQDRPSRRFPAELWHADVMTALGDTLYPPPLPVLQQQRVPPTVCYIDRQSTNRRLPDAFHEWLIHYLQSLHHEPRLDFVHLHMENYAALDQIRLAASCRVLLGVHGNGLSHVAWMQPNVRVDDIGGAGAVVEFFFDYPFYYDYATLSQLFSLRYFALWNGHVLDAQRIAQRHVDILKETRLDNSRNQTKYSFTQELQTNRTEIAKRLQVAQVALQEFLESTL